MAEGDSGKSAASRSPLARLPARQSYKHLTNGSGAFAYSRHVHGLVQGELEGSMRREPNGSLRIGVSAHS
jgi:hypothetical protein